MNAPLHVGIVCPYSLDVPGGVQVHVVGLARALEALGHTVSVLAPAAGDTPLPDFVTSAGRSHGVPYNGSVARVSFGPVSYARARRWLAEHSFDVLHLHEPTTISLSVLALLAAEGPIVATFHTSTERSRALSAFGGVLRPLMEKVTARIAASQFPLCGSANTTPRPASSASRNGPAPVTIGSVRAWIATGSIAGSRNASHQYRA